MMDTNTTAWKRAQRRAVGGGFLVPYSRADEDDDGWSFRKIGLRAGSSSSSAPAPVPDATEAAIVD